MFKSKSLVCACTVFAFAAACLAGKSFFYSPLGAWTESGADLQVASDYALDSALLITATDVITNSAQNVLIPLNGLAAGAKIKGVRLYYTVDATTPGTTYASVRLTQMTTNSFSIVMRDDPSVLSNTVESAHTTIITPASDGKVSGTVTLVLQCIFRHTSDAIHIGGIQVLE